MRNGNPRASFPLGFVIWPTEHSVESYVVSSLRVKNVGTLGDLLHTIALIELTIVTWQARIQDPSLGLGVSCHLGRAAKLTEY